MPLPREGRRRRQRREQGLSLAARLHWQSRCDAGAAGRAEAHPPPRALRGKQAEERAALTAVQRAVHPILQEPRRRHLLRLLQWRRRSQQLGASAVHAAQLERGRHQENRTIQGAGAVTLLQL